MSSDGTSNSNKADVLWKSLTPVFLFIYLSLGGQKKKRLFNGSLESSFFFKIVSATHNKYKFILQSPTQLQPHLLEAVRTPLD